MVLSETLPSLICRRKFSKYLSAWVSIVYPPLLDIAALEKCSIWGVVVLVVYHDHAIV